MPIKHEKESAAEAERAKAGLRQGVAKTKALVAQYRARLSMLKKGSPSGEGRPLFRFDG